MSKEIPFKFLTFQLMAIFVLHKVSKIVNLLSPDGFFQPQNTPKFVFGTPLGELMTLRQTP